MKSRQLEILLYLIEVKKTTYTKLAQQFEVSRKTIMRDIDKLSSMGIPVYTQQGYAGGIFLAPEYRFDKSFFTTAEIEDMILAFHIAAHLKQKTGKNSVLKKLELLVPELAFLKELDFSEYLKIELIEKPVTACTPVCETINTGLDEEVFLRLTIAQTHYVVAPLYYILRTDGLYLYCTDSKCYFTFPIDGITACSTTNQAFNRKDYQTAFSVK